MVCLRLASCGPMGWRALQGSTYTGTAEPSVSILPGHAIRTTPSWAPPHAECSIRVQALHEVTAEAGSLPTPTYIICGPKKSGKSTLARTLCNTLLQQHAAVALLEADCGQPQFGPAGLVSLTTLRSPLLLPAHLMLRQPDDSILIGDTSPQNNPITYLNAVRKLHQLHVSRTEQGSLPPSATAPPRGAAVPPNTMPHTHTRTHTHRPYQWPCSLTPPE